MELGGEEIASLLRSTGPVVKCVLLRAAAAPKEADGDDGDRKPSAKSAAAAADADGAINTGSTDDDGPPPPIILADLIDEIEVDTTPKKAMVSQILGGPFTFLGQYEEEGIMVMVRRPPGPGDSSFDESDDDGSEGEGDEEKAIPPLNPHRLQPPLHKKEVRGDILLMRVAPGEDDAADDAADDEHEAEEAEADDGEEESESSAAAAAADEEKESSEQEGDAGGEIGGDEQKKQDDDDDDGGNADSSTDADAAAAAAAASEAVAATTKSNDDFFLDYTRDEYLKFAARTDIPEHEIDDGGAEEEQEGAGGGSDEDDNDDSDEEFEMGAPEDDDDDAQVGMMNLIFGQILRRFREENGRGPDTRELLEMRSALAERLGVDVPPLDGADWDEKAPKSPGGRKLGRKPPSDGTPKKKAAASSEGSGSNGEDNDDEKLEEEKEDNATAEKGATGGDGTNGYAAKSDVSPVAVAEATPDGRGEKRSAEPSPENSDDDSAARARKRVKFVPKEEHKVHMVERIVHEHSEDDSSDENYVEGGSGGDMDAEEEEEDEDGAGGGDGTCMQKGAEEVETA